MSLRQRDTVRRLEIFGLNRNESIQIINHLNNFIQRNGPEWTISRLKDLKVGFIQSLAGNHPKYEWIKTRNSIPVGPLSRIYSLKKPQKILSCLMVYSSLISHKVTPKQWKKFKSSVEAEPCPEYDYIFERICKSFNLGFKIKDYEFDSTYMLQMYHSKKRAPDFKDPEYRTFEGNAMLAFNSFGHGKARKFLSKYHAHSIPQWMRLEMTKRWSGVNDVMYSLEHYDFVGRISFIQEPGFKLRAIANPLPCFQILLEPLKQDLLNILKKIPNDFTHDQDEGCTFVQDLLMTGPVSSVDLSDATNNLPLNGQIAMLNAIYGEKHPLIDLFKDVSTSKWRVDGPDGETFLKWRKGQPLGLGPSFASFALFHHLIVRFAMYCAGEDNAVQDLFAVIKGDQPTKQYPYCIVGDDIVISSEFTQSYIDIVQSMGCKISFDKTILDSATTAEFCSRVIQCDRIYRQFKWTKVSDHSFLDFARHHGPRSVSLLRPKQRRVVDFLSQIPYTIGGPLSWNPDGLPLEVRENLWWEVAEELLQKEETELSVPRDRLYYDLQKQLNLIRFNGNPNLGDLIHNGVKSASAKTDPIRAFVDVGLSVFMQHDTDKVPDTIRKNLIKQIVNNNMIDYVDTRLTHEERLILKWIIAPNDKVYDNNPYLEKLFQKILDISSRERAARRP